ncbi:MULTISPECIES: LuxR C-terminal-related transcriptional regulator [Bacillales]|uniref:LuxR C-terminal-related transcriptional regulator n=2 Tax=Bacillales TaxID=1385 RepID=A0ABZ0RUM5_9BACI|nr:MULTISPECIES: LuxR C-terminal-related transcriptional regulator [Bacillales]MCT6924513.1 LuxR C-terminal-related transcriptional regulator [Metasolibacillus sp.]MCT6940773.1 LuxR C-terminal-related transcriptional regulator [Metasolibacillus sp.]MEC1177671.1 LuxR C-terminal-related transcriptional regulator [Metasolibacillus meyeri]WPK10731.1 LuxR C-terminal-related transcriptional regulator [Lysinibacillus louembei]
MGNSQSRLLLTKREREIFQLLIEDYSTKEISEKLAISEKTVRNHISNTIQKLGVSSRTQALIELLRLQELKLNGT